MSNLPPAPEAEPKPVSDNARKFIVAPVDPELIPENNSFVHDLTIHWVSTEPNFEVKDVKKINARDEMDGAILRIIKTTYEDGSRETVREPISLSEFLRTTEQFPDMPHLEKRRTEFFVVQNGKPFLIKYDEFAGNDLRMIEVEIDPRTHMTEDDLVRFDPNEFFGVEEEVTSDARYKGYRIVETLKSL